MARTDDVNIRLKILGAREIVRGTSQATRSISGMQKKIEKTGASSVVMAQGLESGRRGINAIGSALKFTGLALGSFAAFEIPRALNAFRESEKASRNVEAAIQSTGGIANVTGKHIDSLSEKMMFKVGVDDEQLKNAAAMILTFKNIKNFAGQNNKVFDETLQLSADLAARFGTDIPGGAKQLSKALNDPAQALSAMRRSGVSFTDQQSEMITGWFEHGEKLRAQKFIMKELSEQVAGAAASQVDSVDRMQLKWGEIEEQIGRGLMPLFDDLAGVASGAMNKVSRILDNRKLTGEEKFDRVMDVIDNIIGEGIDKLDDYMPKIAEAGAGLGGRFAVSLGRAFLNSSIWGKLFIGAWLWKVLLGGQGSKVLVALGTYMGKRMGKAMLTALAPVFAAELAAGGKFGALIKSRFMNLGKWASRMFTVGIILGIAGLAWWAFDEISKKISPAMKQKMLDLGLAAGDWFVRKLIDAVNWGLEKIASGLDKLNFLAAVGVDAPNFDPIGYPNLTGGQAGDPEGGRGGSVPGGGYNPNIPHGTFPPSGKGKSRVPKGTRLPMRPLRIEVPLIVDGRQLAIAVAEHAENAAALK